jgi:hypothetical protein
MMFFVLAIRFIPLATGLVTAQTSLAEPAADECKTKPGSSAPRGSHWYYRINRMDQRRCLFSPAHSDFSFWGAESIQWRLVFVGFADDRRFVGPVFVLFVFVLLLLIIIVVGISRRYRVAYVSENLLDATCPLLL